MSDPRPDLYLNTPATHSDAGGFLAIGSQRSTHIVPGGDEVVVLDRPVDVRSVLITSGSRWFGPFDGTDLGFLTLTRTVTISGVTITHVITLDGLGGVASQSGPMDLLWTNGTDSIPHSDYEEFIYEFSRTTTQLVFKTSGFYTVVTETWTVSNPTSTAPFDEKSDLYAAAAAIDWSSVEDGARVTRGYVAVGIDNSFTVTDTETAADYYYSNPTNGAVSVYTQANGVSRASLLAYWVRPLGGFTIFEGAYPDPLAIPGSGNPLGQAYARKTLYRGTYVTDTSPLLKRPASWESQELNGVLLIPDQSATGTVFRQLRIFEDGPYIDTVSPESYRRFKVTGLWLPTLASGRSDWYQLILVDRVTRDEYPVGILEDSLHVESGPVTDGYSTWLTFDAPGSIPGGSYYLEISTDIGFFSTEMRDPQITLEL
jgi:hypothetical protein